MKTVIRENKSLKKIILPLIVIATIVIGFGAYKTYQYFTTESKVKQNTNQENKTNYNKPIQEQIDQGNVIKNETINKTPTNNETNTDNSTSSTGSLVITRPLENEVISNILQIRTLINGVNDNSKCELIMSNANKSITKTAGIQALASSSTCQGFDIPVSDLSSGEWTIKINIINNSSNLTATRKIKI